MLKYTKASINMLIDDCKRIAKIFKYVSLAFTIVFLSYQIVNGIIFNEIIKTILNGSLLFVFVVTLLIEFALDKRENKSAKKVVKNLYKWFKIVIKLGTLVLTIYEIVNSVEVDGLQIILASVMILLWILSLVSQIVLQIVTRRAEIILVAFKQDVDDIKRPFVKVSNTFKRLTGREVQQEEIDNRKIEILNKLNERIRQDKIKDEDDD